MGIIRLPAELMFVGCKYGVPFSLLFTSALTTAQPMLLVPRSSPNIFFIFCFCLFPKKVSFLLSGQKMCLCLQYKIEANHNKDYSVVKTFKAEGKPFVFLFVMLLLYFFMSFFITCMLYPITK